jgi:WxL domain surface cell wall-binding
MRFFKNHSIGFYLGFVLILAMTIGASAIATLADSGPVTATLIGGSLTETSDFSGASVSVTLTGKDQTPSYKLPITVTDATGSGAGWHLTITSTQFKTAGPPSIGLSPLASHITGVVAQCQVGNNCTASTSISHPISYPLLVPTASATPPVSEFFSADMNSGMGTILVTPTISVKIPGNAYAAAYTSSITLGIVSGP